MTDQELVEKAFTMLEKAYIPYSHFPVGAALEGAHRPGKGGQRGLPFLPPPGGGGQRRGLLLALRLLPPDAV